jgi:hypothetical protein
MGDRSSTQVSPGAHSQAHAYVKIAGQRVAIDVITLRGVQVPRLRFDRVALGLVRRLQAPLSRSVPDGNTVIVTITAPIRQDSKTGAALEDRIRRLLAARRTELTATIYGNRIRVHVLKGGGSRTSKLIGFVHNPKPDPSLLFDVTRSVLARIGSNKRPAGRDRWLIITHQDGLAPFETVRQVCLAIRARRVFKRILLAGSEGVRVL